MTEVQFSTRQIGDDLLPSCEVVDWPELSDYFTVALCRTNRGVLRTLKACREIQRGARAEFEAPGSEAHFVMISTPDVVIERYYHPDADDPDLAVEYRIPLAVFMEALEQWAAHLGRFERKKRDGLL